MSDSRHPPPTVGTPYSGQPPPSTHGGDAPFRTATILHPRWVAAFRTVDSLHPRWGCPIRDIRQPPPTSKDATTQRLPLSSAEERHEPRCRRFLLAIDGPDRAPGPAPSKPASGPRSRAVLSAKDPSSGARRPRSRVAADRAPRRLRTTRERFDRLIDSIGVDRPGGDGRALAATLGARLLACYHDHHDMDRLADAFIEGIQPRCSTALSH